jgi:hypothetical protein
MSSSSEDSNKKYIGHLKTKNGGIKILPGEKDNRIIQKRNKILNHLSEVFSGGKSLKEKNISKYFKALGGKYIRNDICIKGDSNQCRKGQKVSIGGAHKLLKLAKNNEFKMDDVIYTFKESAPVLYKKFETRIDGGKYSNYDYNMHGGFNNNLRNKILKDLDDSDYELNNLINEINLIRFS